MKLMLPLATVLGVLMVAFSAAGALAAPMPSGPIHPDGRPTVGGTISCSGNPSCTTIGISVASGDTLVLLYTDNSAVEPDYNTPTLSNGNTPSIVFACGNTGEHGEVVAWIVTSATAGTVTATFTTQAAAFVVASMTDLSPSTLGNLGTCHIDTGAQNQTTVTGGTTNDLTFGDFFSFHCGSPVAVSPAVSVMAACNPGSQTEGFGGYDPTPGASDTQSWTGVGTGSSWSNDGFLVVGVGYSCTATTANGNDIFAGVGPVYVNVSLGTAPFQYVINWGDGTNTTTVDTNSTNVRALHTYVILGNHTISVNVTDVTPAFTLCSVAITAFAASAVTSLTFVPAAPAAAATTYFFANYTASSGLESWSWSFGDGKFSNGTSANVNATHVYALKGNYTTTLRLTDAGFFNHPSRTVVVPEGPPANGSGPPPCLNCGQFVFSSTTTLTIEVAGALGFVLVIALIAIAFSRREK